MEIVEKIISYIKKFYLDKNFRGVLLMSGGFSRGEISVVDNILVSDMETLFIFENAIDKTTIKKSLSELSKLLKNKFDIIPEIFEIEVDFISINDLKRNHKSLPVHQFETFKTFNVLFSNSYLDFNSFNWRVSLESVYDIFFHRVLNQISLAYNFNNKPLNNIFYNRSKKNLSDFLTYKYLLQYNGGSWLVKKKERLLFLFDNLKLIELDKKIFESEFQEKVNGDVFFHRWKEIMLCWLIDYEERSKNGLKTLSNVKSRKAKIYSAMVICYLKFFKSKRVDQNSIIRVFKNSLMISESFNHMNKSLIEGLKSLGYTKKNYPFLNGYFFIYWIRDINYYKSLK
ncbi:hypothetical protein ACOSP6_03090 [Tenacibaculum sp. MEBiC06402]|uniref:hypothetical protein n=1 Tax=unclassified Tenacibaculum TaxID=2635139 RepID=UPI003B9DA8B5